MLQAQYHQTKEQEAKSRQRGVQALSFSSDLSQVKPNPCAAARLPFTEAELQPCAGANRYCRPR